MQGLHKSLAHAIELMHSGAVSVWKCVYMQGFGKKSISTTKTAAG